MSPQELQAVLAILEPIMTTLTAIGLPGLLGRGRPLHRVSPVRPVGLPGQ